MTVVKHEGGDVNETPMLVVNSHEHDPSCSNQASRFQVSTVSNGHVVEGYDNPVMEESEMDHESFANQSHWSLPIEHYPSRRVSIIPDFNMNKRLSSDLFSELTTNISELSPNGVEDRSWIQFTHDAIPRVEHYRHTHTFNKHVDRPSLDQLHNAQQPPSNRKVSFAVQEDVKEQTGLVKFGWIRGVYIRCLLNIWGVMLFLRMGWMVGQAGIGGSILIVLLATTVTVVTTLSMSAICTNGEVKGGGAYYMISRSLGPEFGGAIGMIFFVANAVAVSMYIVGAAETVRDLLQRFNTGIVDHPSSINDVRISGVLLLLLVTCVTGVGMAFENKAQIVLLVMLLAALADYFIGACLTPTLDQRSKGFVGWNAQVGLINVEPDYRDGESFFSVFSIFFPSVIGILAGANISGDLKDPCSAIPKGTLLSIFSTSLSYIMIIIWLGLTVVRDATGSIADVLNGTYTNCTGRPCPHGLSNYNQVMEMSSGFGPIIFVGIFAATLSSALAALVSAPRIFQALCKDKVFAILEIFAKGYGPNNDPRRAAALTFIISLLCTIIGDLNAIAPIISNLFIGAHCLINFSCFHASYVKSPGFRPGFKWYNKWLSLCGSALCIVVMFIMSWITALITIGIVFGLFIYIHKHLPDVNWGDSTQGYLYKNALAAVTKLNSVDEHVKNFRPAILVLTGNPSSRPPLVDFAYNITKKLGLTVCAHVLNEKIPVSVRAIIMEHNTKWLDKRKVRAFYSLYEAETLTQGTKAMIELVGLGKLKPNVIMLGYKSKWQETAAEDLEEYFNLVHLAFDMNLSVAILRVEEGLDYASYFENQGGVPYRNIIGNLHGPVPIGTGTPKQTEEARPQETEKPNTNDESLSSDSEEGPSSTSGDQSQLSNGDQTGATNGLSGMSLGVAKAAARKMSRVVPDMSAKLARFRRITSIEASKFHFREVPPEVLSAVNQFRTKQIGTIDVWWLYDDGGLTLLIPYLLTTRKKWKDCQLRVFCVTTSESVLDETQVNITSLLKKFRINFTSLTVLPDINSPPSENSKRNFQKMISRYLTDSDVSKPIHGITRAELALHKERTNRHLRLRELLELHSKNATLIVMTLPMPRRNSCGAALYMAWLETLTNKMPPFLLVRGNQTSVLTFYS